MESSRDYLCFDHIASPVFVLEIGDDGTPVYAAFNVHARQQSGRPLSDYLGRSALEVYPDAYGRTAYARHCEVAHKGRTITYDLDLPVGDRVIAVRTTLSPEMDDSGKVVCLYGTSQDMTAQKAALEARVEFDTLSSEMEQFVALAAHDLRAPLRNISALTDLIKDDFHDYGDGKVELLNMIETVSAKTLDLITDVLSHTQTAATAGTETVFSFPALCHDICDTLDPKGQHNFDISRATLRCDRTAMQIALRNLIENAIKHGQKDTLDLGITTQDGMPGMIDVTLTDNGCGFSPAALKMMNGGHFKADSGYGLFGVKRLITARGGTVVARNMPQGDGAVVRFSLPGGVLGMTAGLGDPLQHAPLPRRQDELGSRHSA